MERVNCIRDTISFLKLYVDIENFQFWVICYKVTYQQILLQFLLQTLRLTMFVPYPSYHAPNRIEERLGTHTEATTNINKIMKCVSKKFMTVQDKTLYCNLRLKLLLNLPLGYSPARILLRL